MLISELRFLNYQSNLDVPAYCFLIRIYANPSAPGALIYFDPLKSIFDFGRKYTASMSSDWLMSVLSDEAISFSCKYTSNI